MAQSAHQHYRSVFDKLVNPVTRPTRREISDMVANDVLVFDTVKHYGDREVFVDWLVTLPDFLDLPSQITYFRDSIVFEAIAKDMVTILVVVIRFSEGGKISNFYINKVENRKKSLLYMYRNELKKVAMCMIMAFFMYKLVAK